MFRLPWALRKLESLAASERTVLLEAAVLLPLVHAMQQRLPFKRWRALLEQHEPPRAKGSLQPAPVQVAWAVETARRWVPGEYKCLPTAYTAHWLLHRHGHASTIHVGVARDAAGKVEAHAWVDCDGRTLVGEVADMERFVAFPPLATVRK